VLIVSIIFGKFILFYSYILALYPLRITPPKGIEFATKVGEEKKYGVDGGAHK